MAEKGVVTKATKMMCKLVKVVGREIMVRSHAELSRSSDSGSDRRSNSLGLGLLDRCRLRSRLLRHRLSGGVLQRSDRSGLINLRGVLVDLGGRRRLSLGLGLEEVADTGRKAAANLCGRGLLLRLLLVLLLFLLQKDVSQVIYNKRSRRTVSSLGASASAGASVVASAAGVASVVSGAATSLVSTCENE